MTTTFTASNGIEIEISEHGYLLGKGDYGSGPTYATAGPEGIDALREYLQHRRDAELGRWRSKKHPNYVVYPVEGKTREVRVTNEATGVTRSYRDHPDYLEANSQIRTLVAREYFAANPEPKPWHDAKPGEVWVLDIKDDLGREAPAVVNGQPEFRTYLGEYFDLDSPQIVHARRIWPEPEESDDE